MNRSTVAMLLILTGAVGCGANGDPAVRDAGSDAPPADAGSDAPLADVGSDEPSADAGSDEPSRDAGPDGPMPDAGQPDGGIAKDQFLAAYRHARCSYLARCGFMRSLDACLASTTFNSYRDSGTCSRLSIVGS